jgi:hypothetical protein
MDRWKPMLMMKELRPRLLVQDWVIPSCRGTQTAANQDCLRGRRDTPMKPKIPRASAVTIRGSPPLGTFSVAPCC